jgi:lysyl-tRNA synthetase class 2
MKEAVLRYWPSKEIEKLTLPQAEELTLAQLDDHQAMANRVPGLNQWLQQRGMAPIPAQAVEDKRSGELLALFFELVAEEHLIQPTFIVDYPLEVSPLSKQKPDNPNFVERFELYIGGMEIANAFSELNDPEEQRNRFQYQQQLREKGDLTAHAIDEDYIRALSYGMPPTGGEGVGIDRLTMLLTDSRSIRDVILFPLLRPEKHSE